MKLEELRTHLQKISRIPIVNPPSPLEPLERFSSRYKPHKGPEVWIKRDDELGPGLGGNKGRKLAYLMADVLNQNKRKVITFGGLQSNHARMTAAACAKLDLEAHLFFFERKPRILSGNLMLNHLLGAKMHFIPFGGKASNSMTLETTNRIVRLVSKPFAGHSTYFMPGGGHSVTGCLGYVEATCEIYEQLLALGLPLDKCTIVTAVGTGGTLAGLMAGLSLLGNPFRVLGIDIGNLWKAFPKSIANLSTKLCAYFGSQESFRASDVPIIERRYVGFAYAHPTAESTLAIQMLAQTEGILLDPVYTGKAFAGMIDLIEQKHFRPEEKLIFLHSGGLPALWA